MKIHNAVNLNIFYIRKYLLNFSKKKNNKKENKKTDAEPCSDVVDECDSSVGLLCQGTDGFKKCS